MKKREKCRHTRHRKAHMRCFGRRQPFVWPRVRQRAIVHTRTVAHDHIIKRLIPSFLVNIRKSLRSLRERVRKGESGSSSDLGTSPRSRGSRPRGVARISPPWRFRRALTAGRPSVSLHLLSRDTNSTVIALIDPSQEPQLGQSLELTLINSSKMRATACDRGRR